MDKVQKIRAEIDRLLNKEWKWHSSIEGKYRCETYRELLQFIDSLPNEPISDDLEKAAGEYANLRKTNYEVAKFAYMTGAQWQKEQFEKNRLAACERQTREEAEREQDFVMSIINNEHRQPTFSDAIEYGIRWQKEQMMEEAINEEVVGVFGAEVIIIDKPENTKVGDKVKVIIVKDNGI